MAAGWRGCLAVVGKGLKKKWQALLDKYKSICDNSHHTGRERKMFKHYEDIDKFMASSDKVNPRFVKETKPTHKIVALMIPTIFYRPEIKKAVGNQRNGRP